MRNLLWLVVVLGGVLSAREFMTNSDVQRRLTLRGARIVSEQSIAASRESPPLLVPITDVPQQAVEPPRVVALIKEVPQLGVQEAPPAVAWITDVPQVGVRQPHPVLTLTEVVPKQVVHPLVAAITDTSVQVVHEPPTLVALITEVAGDEPQQAPITHLPRQGNHESLPLVAETGEISDHGGHDTRLPVEVIRDAPVPTMRELLAERWTGPEQTMSGTPSLVVPIGAVADRNISVVHGTPTRTAALALARVGEVSVQEPHLVATQTIPDHAVQDTPPLLAPTARGFDQNVLPVHQLPTLATIEPDQAVAASDHGSASSAQDLALQVPSVPECERIWDQMTHMTKEEWAVACRRVDDERQANGPRVERSNAGPLKGYE